MFQIRITTNSLSLLAILVASGFDAAAAQDNVLIDFDSNDVAASATTSHEAKVILVEETVGDQSVHAIKTVADANAEAAKYFRTGFEIPASDLSKARVVRFSMKTDIEGGFNLQLHSDPRGASVLPFKRVGSTGTWEQIEARLSSRRTPPWSRSEVDLSRVNRIQFTAFGNGPYDGKYVMICDLQIDHPRLLNVERAPLPVTK
ncbi:MAG: hypothetical protein AAF745_12550, partial [Planctomycetota bacterium]